MSESELALVKHKIEQHVCPEIAEARGAALNAKKEAEKCWAKAINKIAEHAGLTKGPDDTWRDPATSEAA